MRCSAKKPATDGTFPNRGSAGAPVLPHPAGGEVGQRLLPLLLMLAAICAAENTAPVEIELMTHPEIQSMPPSTNRARLPY
jgi:hypothetical protein